MSSADALSLTKEIYPVLQSQGYWQGYTWNQQSDGKSWRAFNSAFVLRDEQQEIIAQCFFIRDTTAEYEAEQAYQQQAERLTLFEALVENANDGVVVSDLVGNLQYLNPSVVRMNGMPSKEEYLKADLSKLLDPEELVRVATEVMPAVQRNGQWQGYIWGLRPDGTHWRGFNSVFLLADDHGKPLLQCSIVRDVTAEFEAEQERADLQEQVIQAQKAALRELSTPLIPLADGVLVMPLVGTVDSQRAQEVLETLLEGVSSNRANIAIIDITGVKVVDTQVANALLRTAQAARLLGSQVVLTGISPEVAQTLIGMGADLQGIVTRGTLQSGIKFALQEA
jgi:PAS domain S-box-containing protein